MGTPRSPALLGAALVTAVATAGALLASDHQDTPEVELNPRMDINDVYAFPGASADRIVLVLTTSSPIAGQNASFDPNLLYQIKVDNTGDAKEDLVFQATFDRGTGTAQKITLRGPVPPVADVAGTPMSKLVTSGPELTGNVGSLLGTAGGTQLFAGLRADPFFIDLEQFFKILPDRRPSTGPLSTPAEPTATAFRDPGIDFLRQFNALAIVVELPTALLQPSTATDAKIGVWGTISR
ncbi:MAG: DUF4331 family protein [Gemmatimonadaceae bacterium]